MECGDQAMADAPKLSPYLTDLVSDFGKVLMTDAVTNIPNQDLPCCHRHPDKLCPGECQYILPADQCIHDQSSIETR